MIKLFEVFYLPYFQNNRFRLANTSTKILDLIRRSFLLTGSFLLLISGCNTLEPIEVEPESKKYKIANSDPTVIDLMEESVYSNPNQRLNKIKYREDSIYVIKTGELATYSIPIKTEIVGASENLILELEDGKLVKAAIYSLQPKQVWYDENYEGNDTDFTTIEGDLIVTDLFSGEETVFSNIPSGSSSRQLTQDCNFTIASAEESPNWYIWIDLESCGSGGGTSSGGSDSGDPYGGSPDADNNPDSGTGSSSGGGSSTGSVPISGDEDSMNDVPCHIGLVRDASGECVRDCGPDKELVDGICMTLVEAWEENVCQTEAFKANDCVSSVWNKMKSTNAVIDILDKFENSSWVDLCIDASLSTSANAQTAVDGSNVNINFNTSKLGRSQLSIARTFLHELVHAELFRKVKSVGGNVSQNDFPGIFDYYRRYVENWQHQQMAAHYINTIANGLSLFDGGSNQLSYYKNIAWVGLWKVPDYTTDDPDDFIETQAWKDLSSSEQNRIKSAISNFKATENTNCQ